MMEQWWKHYPWRNIQTNLREKDMEDIDAKAYVSQLKKLGATVTLLNAAGIMASYDTGLEEIQPKSRCLHGSSLEDIVRECHREGIRAFCRTDFSRIRRDVYERHPEWAFRTAEGDIAEYNGFVSTCPNGDYQKIYMHRILREVLTKIPFDGVYCNMSGFMTIDYDGKYYGFCHCESCKKKFRSLYGKELPIMQRRGDPQMIQMMGFQRLCENEYRQRLVATVKSIRPQIAVHEYDYIRSESNTEIGRISWPYSAASNARKYSMPGRKRLVDNNAVDFMGFRYRDISVSPALMELRQWQNLAHSGNLSVYIMGHLGNHRDMSWYDRTKKVFDFHKKYESFYTDLESDAKVVLVRVRGIELDSEGQGWVRALTQSHIPFDEVLEEELTEPGNLEKKELLLLPNIMTLSDRAAAAIDMFVHNGGTLLATGTVGMCDEQFESRKGKVCLKCLGIEKMTGRKEGLKSTMLELLQENVKLFPRCGLTPYIAPGDMMVTVLAKEHALTCGRLIPEHPYGPPEICGYTEVSDTPGIYAYSYGRGKSVYLPFAIGNFYAKEGYQNTLSFVQDLLFELCGAKEIAPGLTPMVEIVRSVARGKKMIQFINESGCFANHYMDPVPVYDLTVKVEEASGNGTEFTEAKTLNGGRVNLERVDGQLLLQLNVLHEYEAVVLS